MSQAWYVGPVARAGSGDWGMEVGFVVSVLCYTALRWVERWWDRRQDKEEVREMRDTLKV